MKLISCVFVAYACRLLVLGTYVGDAVGLWALAALYAVIYYIDSTRLPPPIALNAKVLKELEELKGVVGGMKLGASLRK